MKKTLLQVLFLTLILGGFANMIKGYKRAPQTSDDFPINDVNIYATTLTNPEDWPCGKFSCDDPHINLHVDVRKSAKQNYTALYNFQIYSYKQAGKICFYVYENHEDKVYVDDLCGGALEILGDFWGTFLFIVAGLVAIPVFTITTILGILFTFIITTIVIIVI
ncbi:609_t:CDS:1 [Paraglomus brasilianum]|uniref:609_t:CDS:1 n=1 Tax=Paraglomus brasilianum TaxID=144538 RepID=A0A9N9BQJ1_9GLOM|nr:609_t:CDS:1 [Paraglomus brasilianum]